MVFHNPRAAVRQHAVNYSLYRSSVVWIGQYGVIEGHACRWSKHSLLGAWRVSRRRRRNIGYQNALELAQSTLD